MLDDAGGTELTLRTGRVARRNWSRVAVASASDGQPRRVFVKQFIDAGGLAHPQQWAYERDGIVLARRVLGDVIEVPALLAADRERLLHVYEHHDLVSFDKLLRRSRRHFDAAFADALRIVAQCLATLAAADTRQPDAPPLPVKQRGFGGDALAINFKGLDIRNVGVRRGATDGPRFVMFDFGRPYLGPIEEAAAKLFVSVGLLNWGRPVRRFARGPETALLASARTALDAYLQLDAVLAEIDYQQRIREQHVIGRNRLMYGLKYAGVVTLGRRYFRHLRRWCRRELRDA